MVEFHKRFYHCFVVSPHGAWHASRALQIWSRGAVLKIMNCTESRKIRQWDCVPPVSRSTWIYQNPDLIYVCVCELIHHTPKYTSLFLSMAQVVASLMRKRWENDVRSAPRGTAKFGGEAWHSGCQVSGSQSP